jgi:hypothetical protein
MGALIRSKDILDALLASHEPAIHFKARWKVCGEPLTSAELVQVQRQIPTSQLVKGLLSEQAEEGRIPLHPYQKWRGAHWVLACLADLGYPPGDPSLTPLMDQVYEWLLGRQHTASIQSIQGRVRRCASMEGNALFASLALGLADERSDELARRLMSWQWPDGGWNCDKYPQAVNSSYNESLIPLRALNLYAQVTGLPQARQACERAAEIFLKRELFKRQSDGSLIEPDFITLHYPAYWHYEILSALKALAEAGFLSDPRCQAALELLEARELPGGGFPAEKAYYKLAPSAKTGRSLVRWGEQGPRKMNEFVTVDALYVLKMSGRY